MNTIVKFVCLMIRCILIIVVCTGLLASCKPETPVAEVLTTEVYGRVVQRDTEQKATNLPLKIRAYRDYIADDAPAVLWPPRTIKLMAETLTDTNGFYHLKFEADDLDKFGYYITLESNISGHVERSADDWMRHGILPGQSQQKKFQFTPFAWLRIKTRNIDSYPSDKFTIYYGNDAYHIWGPVERQLLIAVAGNRSNMFSSALTRQGVIINTNFEVYAPAFDTTDFLIEY
jgi:hypothetical protein